MTVAKQGQILVDLIWNEKDTMFLTEVADFFQDFTIPYTASRIVRITQNIEFHLLLHNVFFQMIKINLEKTVFFD